MSHKILPTRGRRLNIGVCDYSQLTLINMLEHIGLEICGRVLLKKRNETLRSLAVEYCCHNKTIQNQYLRFVDTSAEVAKVAAENYYSRTPAHHHDHVGSTAVPGQLSEARGCPAPARKRNTDKAANAAAAQPSLPHGGGAAARAPDASQVAASSVVSAELVRRVKERRPHGNDSSRIIAKLDIDGIFTIEDCTLYGVSDYVKSGWKRADVNVVLLDDRAWASLLCVATAKTPEDFIRGILGSIECTTPPRQEGRQLTRATTAAGSPEPPPGGAEALFPLNTNDIAPTQRGAVLGTGAWCRSDRPEAQTTVTRSPPGLPSYPLPSPAAGRRAADRSWVLLRVCADGPAGLRVRRARRGQRAPRLLGSPPLEAGPQRGRRTGRLPPGARACARLDRRATSTILGAAKFAGAAASYVIAALPLSLAWSRRGGTGQRFLSIS